MLAVDGPENGNVPIIRHELATRKYQTLLAKERDKGSGRSDQRQRMSLT